MLVRGEGDNDRKEAGQATSSIAAAKTPPIQCSPQSQRGGGGGRKEVGQGDSNPASQHSSQDSGELLSWEDFLVSTSPTHQGPQAAPPILSEGSGDDSIWLEYGSV